jgi:hypothetical protein
MTACYLLEEPSATGYALQTVRREERPGPEGAIAAQRTDDACLAMTEPQPDSKPDRQTKDYPGLKSEPLARKKIEQCTQRIEEEDAGYPPQDVMVASPSYLGLKLGEAHWRLTLDMSGDRRHAKHAGGRPLDGRVRHSSHWVTGGLANNSVLPPRIRSSWV